MAKTKPDYGYLNPEQQRQAIKAAKPVADKQLTVMRDYYGDSLIRLTHSGFSIQECPISQPRLIQVVVYGGEQLPPPPGMLEKWQRWDKRGYWVGCFTMSLEGVL